MSTTQKNSSGPNGVLFLIKSAFIGAVTTLVLIPVFLRIFRELASVYQTFLIEGGVYSQELSAIFLTGRVVFGVLPVVSTIGAIGIAYANLGPMGVVLYLIVSSAATGMLAGSTTAVLTFILGVIAMLIVQAIKSKSRHRKRIPARSR